MPIANPQPNEALVGSGRAWKGRAVLLLGLLLLVAVSWGLKSVMPPANLEPQFDGRRPFVYWYSGPPGYERDYTNDPFEIYDDPIKFMNVDTGEITDGTRADVVWHGGVNANGERVEIVVPVTRRPPNSEASQIAAMRVHVYFKNMETGVSRHVEFDMPGTEHTIVNNRFAVSRDHTKIYAVDLEDSTHHVFSTSSVYSGSDASVKAIYGSELLYEVHSQANGSSTFHILELFKLADHEIQLVKTLEIGCFNGVTRWDGQLLTLSADGKSVEFRSLDDLELVKTVEISEQILAEYDVDDIQGILLHGVNKQTREGRFFHIPTQTQINLPQSNMGIRWFSGADDRYWCFSGSKAPYSLVVYDMQEHRVCLQVPDTQYLAFLDDGRFAVSYRAFGVTTIVYDLQTGKSIRQAPYQWCAIALAAVMLCWFGWCIAWLVVSAREGTRALWDLAMIFVVVPVTLASIGAGTFQPMNRNLFGPQPISLSAVVGVFHGLLCVSAIWIGLRRSRRSIEILLPTLIFAVLAWWLNTLPNDTGFRPPNVQVIVLALLHTIGIFLASVFLRRTRSRYLALGESPSDTTVKPVKPHRLTLNDLFIFMAFSAILVAATKPFFKELDALRVWYFISPCIIATPICFVIALTVFSRNQRAFRIGFVVTLFAWIVLIALETWLFSGYRQDLAFSFDRSVVRTIIFGIASTFVCALVFRLRGYRV